MVANRQQRPIDLGTMYKLKPGVVLEFTHGKLKPHIYDVDMFIPPVPRPYMPVHPMSHGYGGHNPYRDTEDWGWNGRRGGIREAIERSNAKKKDPSKDSVWDDDFKEMKIKEGDAVIFEPGHIDKIPGGNYCNVQGWLPGACEYACVRGVLLDSATRNQEELWRVRCDAVDWKFEIRSGEILPEVVCTVIHFIEPAIPKKEVKTEVKKPPTKAVVSVGPRVSGMVHMEADPGQRTFPGPGGRELSQKEWYDQTSMGCSGCNDIIPIADAEETEWIGDGVMYPVCSYCIAVIANGGDWSKADLAKGLDKLIIEGEFSEVKNKSIH
jgi:hypothetical protein